MVRKYLEIEKIGTFSLISFIHILFSLSSWHIYNTLINNITIKYKLNKNIINLIITIITLIILICTNKLYLLSDVQYKNSNILKQIILAMLLILYWVVVWNMFDLIFDKFIKKIKINPIIIYSIIILLSLYYLHSINELALIL